jgi:2,5-diamino-6-(ribosylamino)-4(3H)-pyrimidinone 5'-phosphate reductase
LLAIVDGQGRVRSWQYWRSQPYWRDAVALCCETTPRDFLGYLRERHVDYVVAGKDQVDLRAALGELNERYGVKLVRADSGGTLNGVLLRADLVDEVSLLISPCLVGGTSPRSFYRAPDLTSAHGVIELRLAHVEQMEGDTLWLRYKVVR